MITKGISPIHLLRDNDTHPIFRTYFEFNQLKQLYRQGWLREGLPPEQCESVAEHTLGVAVLSLFLVEAYFQELDALKVLRMAILHDFGEIYAGDLTPSDPGSLQDKHQRELQGLVKVLEKLPNGVDYIALWDEFEAGNTPEARLVRQVDRLEMGMQASIYDRQGLIDPGQFYQSAEQSISLTELRKILSLTS